jgi:hypothetical protein
MVLSTLAVQRQFAVEELRYQPELDDGAVMY